MLNGSYVHFTKNNNNNNDNDKKDKVLVTFLKYCSSKNTNKSIRDISATYYQQSDIGKYIVIVCSDPFLINGLI